MPGIEGEPPLSYYRDRIVKLQIELTEAERAIIWLALNAGHSMQGPHAATIDRIHLKHQP